MQLLVAGLSHHTAPIALRERFALPPEELPAALARLVRDAGFPEGLILSTCNRTEIYARPAGDDAAARASRFLGALRPSVWHEAQPLVYLRHGEDALAHLFRVAAGLDSLVVGEPEIVRQMSEAYALACSAGTAGPVLHRAVPRALQVGKRVRTDTAIARGIVSVAGAAVGLAGRVFRDVSACAVLTIGAGETVETALAALRHGASGRRGVAHPTPARAERVAARFGGTAAPLDDLARLASEADIVIAATAASEPLLRAAELAPRLRGRGARPLLVLDLGVPRDVDPAVADLSGVYLHTVDDLRTIADKGRSERAAEIPKAEAIVSLALSDFRRRGRELEAEPAIKALLDGLLAVRQAAIDGEKSLTDGERAAAERVSGRIVDKVLRRLAPHMKSGRLEPRDILDAFGLEAPGDDG